MLASRQRHHVLWVIWAMCLVALIQYRLLFREGHSCMQPATLLETEINDSPQSIITKNKTLEAIPNHIYQTWKNIAVPEISHVNSWQQKNPDHEYTLFTDNTAKEFLENYYGHRPDIIELYNGLPQRILAADMLRYLIIHALGGVYTDIDTSCTKSIQDWISDENGEKQNINMVVGIEADVEWEPDRVARAKFVDNIQFVQWTVMGKPDHPILNRTIEAIVRKIYNDVETVGNITIEDVMYDEQAILDTTGPWLYSRVIRSYINEKLGRTVTNEEFHNLEKPKLFGDVLVLPVNAWAPESPHSNSGKVATSMLRHWQRGTWRKVFDEQRELEQKMEHERVVAAEQERLKQADQQTLSQEKDVKQDDQKDQEPKDNTQVPPPTQQRHRIFSNSRNSQAWARAH